jgi:PTS system glucitol/sorbitol-specific IIA component
MTIFKTRVKAVGPEAESLKEAQMLILFGEEAPEMLADFCYTIAVNPTSGQLAAGQTIAFDGTAYLVTAVGDVVQKNLEALGHISIKFDGAREAELPGTLYVEEKTLPEIQVDSVIEIL